MADDSVDSIPEEYDDEEEEEELSREQSEIGVDTFLNQTDRKIKIEEQVCIHQSHHAVMLLILTYWGLMF